MFFQLHYYESDILSHTYTQTHTHTHIHYTTMCPNHTQKYICTHTHLPLIRTHTLQYSMSDSHTHCITVLGSYTPIHTYILHYSLTHTRTYTLYYFVFDSNAYMHPYIRRYTPCCLIHIHNYTCSILFCIICINIHTHALYTTI